MADGVFEFGGDLGKGLASVSQLIREKYGVVAEAAGTEWCAEDGALAGLLELSQDDAFGVDQADATDKARFASARFVAV